MIETSMLAWTAVLAGPAVGSFVGLLADRLPRGEPVAFDRSRCRCGRTLGMAELVPILSWLVLRGRCRGCGEAIGLAPLAFELAALAIALWSILAMPADLVLPTCGLGWCLLALAAIDLACQRLPDLITLPLAAGGIALHAVMETLPLAAVLTGAAAGYLAFAAIALAYRRLRGRDGLGLGDAKLLAAGGAWLGWEALPGVVLTAALAGIATALLLRRSGGERLPFGPALALAIWAAWLYGPLEMAP